MRKRRFRDWVFERPKLYFIFQTLVSKSGDPKSSVKWIFGLDHEDRVLDIGCGEGRKAGYIASQVSEYVGFDNNPQYVDSCNLRLSKIPTAKAYLASAEEDTFGTQGKFTLAMASGVLHHLDSTIIHQLLNNVAQVLGDGGRFVAIEPCFHPNQSLIARLMIAADRGRFVRDVEGYTALLGHFFSNVESRIHFNLLRVPYTHVILTCRNPLSTEQDLLQ